MKRAGLKYQVRTKKGKAKTLADTRWCRCGAHEGPHMHPKGRRGVAR
jgi:hypothetical protein